VRNDDDPREVKRARERAAPFSQRESRQRQRGKRGRNGTSAEDGVDILPARDFQQGGLQSMRTAGCASTPLNPSP